MFCIKCGTKLPDEAVFCYKCGCKVVVSQYNNKDEVVSSEKENLQKEYNIPKVEISGTTNTSFTSTSPIDLACEFSVSIAAVQKAMELLNIKKGRSDFLESGEEKKIRTCLKDEKWYIDHGNEGNYFKQNQNHSNNDFDFATATKVVVELAKIFFV